MERFRGSLLGKLALHFDTASAYVPSDLSCAARTPDGTLIVAADERSSLELLTPGEDQHGFVQRHSQALHEALAIGPDDEVDLEGLCKAFLAYREATGGAPSIADAAARSPENVCWSSRTVCASGQRSAPAIEVSSHQALTGPA